MSLGPEGASTLCPREPAAYNRPSMSAPSRLRRRELAALVFTVAWSAFSFLPAWRESEIGGVAILGWLMACLILLAPVLALVAMRTGRH